MIRATCTWTHRFAHELVEEEVGAGKGHVAPALVVAHDDALFSALQRKKVVAILVAADAAGGRRSEGRGRGGFEVPRPSAEEGEGPGAEEVARDGAQPLVDMLEAGVPNEDGPDQKHPQGDLQCAVLRFVGDLNCFSCALLVSLQRSKVRGSRRCHQLPSCPTRPPWWRQHDRM